MKSLSVEQVLEATGGTLVSGNPAQNFSGISTDSRNVAYGALFIPFVGETFDAHDFIDSALKSGAGGVLISKELTLDTESAVIRVADTKKAYGDIARYYKSKLALKTVAITGSVGKTTTKDMIACVLATQFSLTATEKNYNNEIGVPKTLLNLKPEDTVAVVEMGMNHFGEIRYLASIARPDAAVITNIGMSHIENLGSQEGILKAKLEVLDYLSADGVLFVNGDDALLSTVTAERKIVRFGLDESKCDIYATNICPGSEDISFDAVYKHKKTRVHLNVPGEHNIYNALAAIAVGEYFGLTLAQAAAGVEKFIPSDKRMNIIRTDKIIVLNDCYNASPASIEAAVRVLCGLESARKVAILGDMKELGDFAPAAHGKVGKKVAGLGVNCVIAIGDNAKFVCKGAKEGGIAEENIHCFKTRQQAIDALPQLILPGDAILVKASRAMQLEYVTEALKAL